MKKISLKLLSFLLVFGFITSNVYAETYYKYINDIDGCMNTFGQLVSSNDIDNSDVKINYVNLIYDDSSNQFTIEVKTDNKGDSGKPADSFYFAINSGGMPRYGEIAFIYFDATNPANPLATVYSYNGYAGFQAAESGLGLAVPFDQCNNRKEFTDNSVEYIGGSWSHAYTYIPNSYKTEKGYGGSPGAGPKGTSVAPARIASALSNAIISTNSSPTTLNAPSYTYKLVLDTKIINSYISTVRPADFYQGIKFDENVGIWFWAAQGGVYQYAGDGYISSLDTSSAKCSVCDDGGFITKKAPKCAGVSASKDKIEPLETVTLTIDVQDLDYGEVDNAPIFVSYTGLDLVEKATANPDEGEQVVFSNDTASVNIDYTPNDKEIGIKTFTAKFSKVYGVNEITSDSCEVSVEVVAPAPECKKADVNLVTRADQDAGRLAGLARDLKRSISRIYGRLGIKKEVDNLDESDAENRAWQNYNAIAKDGNYFFECTNTNFCSGGLKTESLSANVSSFDQALQDLYDIGISRAKKFQRVKRRQLVLKGYDVATAKRMAKRQTNRKWLQGPNRTGIEPAFASATTQVQEHIDTYGTNRYTCVNAKTAS